MKRSGFRCRSRYATVIIVLNGQLSINTGCDIGQSAFVYLLNDPDLDGPKTERGWRAAINVLHESLGVRGKLPGKYVIDVFVDVGELR